jgi:acetyl esterase/lipase
MSHDSQPDHISKKRVVYTIPGVEAVTVRRDRLYRVAGADALTMDVYYPADPKNGAPAPAVIFVTGFPDDGAQKMIGCKQKEMGSYISWARLAAATGLVAITYVNKEPSADAQAVLQHARQNAASLAIDETRIGVWACSGSVPNALSLLMADTRDRVKCAVLCYGYTLDSEGSTSVADAARRWGFVTPCAGKSVDDLARDIPLFIARAGRDEMPGLNEALDRFLPGAVARNLPVTFVNLPLAPHAFDLFDDSQTARETVRRILEFLRCHLLT